MELGGSRGSNRGTRRKPEIRPACRPDHPITLYIKPGIRPLAILFGLVLRSTVHEAGDPTTRFEAIALYLVVQLVHKAGDPTADFILVEP